MRLLLQVILTALAFIYVLPMIHGIQFHGGLVAALALAIFFGAMTWVVDILAIAFSAFLAVSTFGLALLWLIPLWILGFWLLPAVALMLVSNFLPAYLTITGWTAAILGSLVLMLISIITSSSTYKTILVAK